MNHRFCAIAGAVIALTSRVQDAVAMMQGKLQIYRDPAFKRLRRIIGISIPNLCYDMPCADLSGIICSAKWTGLPAKGSPSDSDQVKIAFYAGSNCTGKFVLLKTSAGQVLDFAEFGLDHAVTSFAVLETSMMMMHLSSNICEW
uniref:Uncharacterized protein n=1 Tax=Peronospora matthiolae TaxID=2874970 RepID=A0AAV1ULA4_9STRA